MVSIYQYGDFRKYVRNRFEEMPKKGHGQAFKLAKYLGVHPTLMSQILRGDRVFTLEQGHRACIFFGMNELESDFFILLIQI